MDIGEEIKAVREVMQVILKSKKVLRMYPANNPIYINALEDSMKKFKEFFYYKDDLALHVKQNEILFDGEQVYSSPEKEDNLALFFFKDGLREITFKKGLTVEEMEDFMKIVSLDVSREALDDDIVTLFWEKDFQHIHYVVDELTLADEDDYEARAIMEVREKAGGEDSLLRAYEDAFREDEVVQDISIVPLADKDLQSLLKELEKDVEDKMPGILDILFEMIHMCETGEDYLELTAFFKGAVEYAVRRGDIDVVSTLLVRMKETASASGAGEEIRKLAKRVVLEGGSERIISILGEVLDSGHEVDEKIVENYVRLLDRNAIEPFMKILGELKSIHARKVVIDALVVLGTKDIVTLAKGLNDTRWYVVRNIIYILRKIGDKRAVDYLLKTVRHGDIRVKKEVIMTLGELGGGGSIQVLRECLDDGDDQVRKAALKAFSRIGSEASKRIILNKIVDKSFRDKDFDEKKEFFEALSRWKDEEIYKFLIETVKKNTFFGRSKTYENRACAAYCLGLLGKKEALPLLGKYRNDGNKLLREFAHTAIKRLEYGQ